MAKKSADSEIRICTERNLTGEKSLAAAIKENPNNAGGFAGASPMALSDAAPAMAVVITKLWKPGRTLNISFIGKIDQTIVNKIKFYAAKWLEHANLKFRWVSKNGHIRISCKPGGSWSYIGTDALTIPQSQATMNYGWLTPTTSDTEYSRVVVHEFGHALGAIHEHQHPTAGIPWDKPAVYAYYARQGWDQAQVDNNLFAKYAASQMNSTAYDKLSIMHYAVPNELTIGDYEVGWNTQLSANDKVLAKRVYP
jgi:serralysin